MLSWCTSRYEMLIVLWVAWSNHICIVSGFDCQQSSRFTPLCSLVHPRRFVSRSSSSGIGVLNKSLHRVHADIQISIYAVQLIHDTMWPFCHRSCCCIKHQRNIESKSFNKNNKRLLSSNLEHCSSICMTCRPITLLWIIYKYVGIAKQLYMSSAKSKTTSQMHS